MNAYISWFAELLIGLAVSLAVLRALSGRLLDLLAKLCPDEHAARFWLSYTQVMLMIVPLLLVLSVGLFAHFSNPLDNLRLALIATLGGLLAGLHRVGKRLGQFIVAPQSPRSPT